MHYDHIIVGAGSMGMAAGYYLAREGKKTLLLDAFQPPHDKGSHHGDTRLIRFAYGEGARYVPFVLRAKELWEELETLTDKKVFHRVGILNFTPKDDPYMDNIIQSSKQYNLPVELLTPKEANKRWKGIHLTKDMTSCFEPTSGVLMTQNIIEAYYELAMKAGAEVIGNNRVVKIEPVKHIVKITTENGDTFTADSIILSVGAWSKQIMNDLQADLPITPIRKTFAWYEVVESIYDDSNFPGFTYTDGEKTYYGFPSIDRAGLKIGRHDLGDEVNPDEEKAPFGSVEGDQEDLDLFLKTFMPKVGKLKYGKTCMYTMTPDKDFIIDLLPNHPNIAIAAGFSGHGFKFASAVGEALKDLLLMGKPKIDLSPFSIKRFT
ncbi:N-methyl-L-tryptophan oxidase [Pseudogracilibacillus auburnensis]|uniref:N-methyl-L-tryptophan oxidase n=1 Tax=Pseudogracilibacillus auburnensis TaxID=1494959 RepID=A0A2V3VSI3_9BACI|nr:N-methyl-L-tryptophan oxidase [Pseudogracilibacillus auburnensis]PXW84847.1 N-methyl-L-tryptophan oxidase [Pseudogracilibacillus auburnensis]